MEKSNSVFRIKWVWKNLYKLYDQKPVMSRKIVWYNSTSGKRKCFYGNTKYEIKSDVLRKYYNKITFILHYKMQLKKDVK